MAPVYSTDEKIFMIMQLLSGDSARKVRDLFAVEYPDSPIPSLHTVQKTLEKFRRHGCVNNDHIQVLKKKPVSRQLSEETQTKICASVEVNPNVTSREIAQELGISKTSVLKILKEAGYYRDSKECVISIEGKSRVQRLTLWSRGPHPFEIVTVQSAIKQEEEEDNDDNDDDDDD